MLPTSASSHYHTSLSLSLSLERCLSPLCSLFSLSTLERVSSSRGEVRSSEHVALSRERESYRDVLLAVPRSSACSASLISLSTLERQRDWCVQLYRITMIFIYRIYGRIRMFIWYGLFICTYRISYRILYHNILNRISYRTPAC